MIDTLPLAFITVCSLYAIIAFGIFGYINQSMLIILQKAMSIGSVIKIASNEHFGLWRYSMNRIYRMTYSISNHPSEWTTILIATKLTRLMDHKHMERIARDCLATYIENITRCPHTFYRLNTDRITPDGRKRER